MILYKIEGRRSDHLVIFSYPSRIAGHYIGYSERFEHQHLRGRYSYDDGYGGCEIRQSRQIHGGSIREEPLLT